jgi:hypothetical protein
MARTLGELVHIMEPVSDYYREPIPKPPKVKLKINQAPRQSFRQSMRSVNRNR